MGKLNVSQMGLKEKVAGLRRMGQGLVEENKLLVAQGERDRDIMQELRGQVRFCAVRLREEKERVEAEMGKLTEERHIFAGKTTRMQEQGVRYSGVEKAIKLLITEFVTPSKDVFERLKASSLVVLLEYLRVNLRLTLSMYKQRVESATLQLQNLQEQTDTNHHLYEETASTTATQEEQQQPPREKEPLEDVQDVVKTQYKEEVEGLHETIRLQKNQIEEMEKALRGAVEGAKTHVVQQAAAFPIKKTIEHTSAQLQSEKSMHKRLRVVVMEQEKKIEQQSELIWKQAESERQVKGLKTRLHDARKTSAYLEAKSWKNAKGKFERQIDELKKQNQTLKSELIKVRTKAASLEASAKRMTRGYEELFAAHVRAQQEKQHEEDQGLKEAAKAKYSGENCEHMVDYYKLRLEESQFESRLLCQQLKKSALIEQRERGVHAREKAQLLSDQSRLEESLSRAAHVELAGADAIIKGTPHVAVAKNTVADTSPSPHAIIIGSDFEVSLRSVKTSNTSLFTLSLSSPGSTLRPNRQRPLSAPLRR